MKIYYHSLNIPTNPATYVLKSAPIARFSSISANYLTIFNFSSFLNVISLINYLNITAIKSSNEQPLAIISKVN